MAKFTLLKFYTPTCRPCKAISSTLDKLLPSYPDVELQSIDVTKEADLAAKYHVRSVPTLIILQDGQPVGSSIGSISSSHLKDVLDRCL